LRERKIREGRIEIEPLAWNTERRKVVDLIPYEQNPRILTKKQAGDLRKSLEKFNLVEIPVIDTHDRIIAGHQRLKIMQMIGRGEEEIEVRVPNRELTEKEFQEYNIRSNKNTGEWDFDILANSFDTSDLVGWGFDEKELGGKNGGEDEGEGIVPQKNPNVLIRLSVHPGMWLGKREEILTVLEKMKASYNLEFKVEE
jgi:hypothetical protein